MINKFFTALGEGQIYHYSNKQDHLIFPYTHKYDHMPDIVIKNPTSFNALLAEYITTCKNTKIGFTNPFNIKNSFEDFFLGQLIRDMSKTDFENIENYVAMRTQFIKDNTFQKLDNEQKICPLENNFELSCIRVQEPHGLETPYSMNYYIRRHSKPYRLPKVRYGIFERNGEKNSLHLCSSKRFTFGL